MKLSVLLSVLAATGASFANELTISDDVIVKTGPGTEEITAAQVGSRSVRVEEGVLRIVQESVTKARYVRFTVREKNPWRTTNAGVLVQMDSFQLVKGGDLVAYPEGTTACNSDGSEGTAPKVLTYERTEAGNWCENGTSINGFTIDMGESVEFDGYVIGPATISTGRMPYSFTVEVGVDDGADGIDWALFDDKTQYCTSGYGADWFTGANNYSPRMPPVYAPNPLSVFSAAATVTVASGATLELADVSGRLPNLSGSGTVRLAGGSPELTGDCTFAGAFDGYGRLLFAMDNDVVSGFSFASLALQVENVGKARSFAVVGAETSARLPIILDRADAPLDLTLVGKIETAKATRRFDRFDNELPFVRYGRTLSCNAEIGFADEVPTLFRYVRYIPISGSGSLTIQAQEIKLFSGGELQPQTDFQFAVLDAFRTTNYTSNVLSDQHALICSPGQMNTGIAQAQRLFDADSATYYQHNLQTAYGLGGSLSNSPALTVTFRGLKAFDRFEFWQPTYDIANNPAYWPGMWRLETSVDGNTWELLDDQSKEKVETSRLYTGWPPVVTTPVSSGAAPRTDAWFAIDEYELAADESVVGALKYVRLFLRELSNSSEVTNGASYIDIAELELHKNGSKVDWPEGTVCTRTDAQKTAAPGLINAPVAMPYDDWQHATDNEAADGGGDRANAQRVQWDPGYAQLCRGAGFVVEMPEAVDFDQYKLFAGYNQDGLYRIPSKWTLDVSYDGENWTAVDSADRENGFDVPSVWTVFQFFVKRSVDFSSVGRFASDRFADDKPLKIDTGVTLTLANANETIGGLNGAGAVALADADLTVKDGDSLFSGVISGTDGTLVVDGGTLVLAKADLTGLAKVVLRNGATLKGKAAYQDGLVFDVEEGCINQLRKIGNGLMLILH